MKLKIIFIYIFSTIAAYVWCQLPKEFVYLHDIDPTIIVDLRYATAENFIGRPIPGYKKHVAILTKQAALALKQVQEHVKKDGYSLVVYDAYRPQKAVDSWIQWAKDVTDQIKRKQYYPRVEKTDLAKFGYIPHKRGSSHGRGSTVDLTLIHKDQKIHSVVESSRQLLGGTIITYLDDGTIDMGSSFDLFDVASHYANNVLPKKYKKMRTYLKNVMEKYGFNPYAEEWWHFTLKNEPFSADKESSYFNFDVE